MNEALFRDIRQIVSGQILQDEPLCRHTSMGVGGPADALVFPGTVEETGALVSLLGKRGIPFFPMGNGTNLIVRDGGYRGVVISLKHLRLIRVLGELAGGTGIYAEGGASLSELVSLSLTEGLGGLEFCAGIPGSIGGAVKMNAGAYGSNMEKVIHAVTLMDHTGHIEEYTKEVLSFSYRCLRLPEGSVILSATYRLAAGNGEEMKTRIREILAKRKGKHPLEYKNAGSIFKNPPGKPAGQIIEELGLKGLQVGGAKVSEKHGNFIVNTGSARAGDITALIRTIQDTACEKTGILMETEVVIIGEEA